MLFVLGQQAFIGWIKTDGYKLKIFRTMNYQLKIQKMKKLILLLALSVVVATTAMAQSSVTGTAHVKVKILQGLSVTSVTDLDFGTITAAAGSQTISSTDNSAGEFEISGAPSADVSVTFTAPSQLSSGSANIPFTAATPTYSTSSSASGSTSFNAATGGSATIGSDGKLYLFIGGQIDPTNASAGSYSANYTAEISYDI